jgi:outer membrane protein OmpA-like peptidoglycan-associated protein
MDRPLLQSSLRISLLAITICLATSSYVTAQNYDGLDSARINLGPAVNSKYSDLFPIVSPDEQMLFFTRKGAPENAGFADRPDDEDIWYSLRTPEGGWSLAKRIEGPLNTKTYDGVRAINSTADHLYLQNVYRADGSRGKGFSISVRDHDGTWSFPDSLEIVNYYNDTNTAMMTVASDEETIIFSLLRRDTKGEHDLYLSHHLGGRKWSEPQPIEMLNTPGDEISPFLAFDNKTLYFSTNGREGYGSQDVFVSHRLDDSWLNWSPPENMGAPINTIGFDAYFMLSAHGDTAYLSSAQGSSVRGFGKSDIWKIAIPKNFRPGFKLDEPFPRAAALENSSFRLDGVYFDVDRSSLQQQSEEELDKLVRLLEQYPEMVIEVQGHTDSDGTPDHNMLLSEQRALKVRAFLVEKGVDQGRIMAKGFGETVPIAPNTTAAGKSLNRRVMIRVVKIGAASHAEK